METWKKQKNVANYACFCTATTLNSKIIAEIVKKRSEFDECSNSCNKFVSSQS